mmetsp:Transcript_16111/g.38215  ORF Transcript_16111/g.38215 Transcript_16111/m.38215 type:complete len:268 (-) Transcript_16111:319-1122(-)
MPPVTREAHTVLPRTGGTRGSSEADPTPSRRGSKGPQQQQQQEEGASSRELHSRLVLGDVPVELKHGHHKGDDKQRDHHGRGHVLRPLRLVLCLERPLPTGILPRRGPGVNVAGELCIEPLDAAHNGLVVELLLRENGDIVGDDAVDEVVTDCLDKRGTACNGTILGRGDNEENALLVPNLSRWVPVLKHLVCKREGVRFELEFPRGNSGDAVAGLDFEGFQQVVYTLLTRFGENRSIVNNVVRRRHFFVHNVKLISNRQGRNAAKR